MKNTKIFTILLLGIFLISFASAFEFDNVKKYNPVTREATIYNTFLGIKTSQVGMARLNTPLNNKVAVGYQKVAEFDLWAYTDYNDIIKNIDFYDKNNEDWKNYKFTRNFDIKYKSYEERLIDDYDNIFVGYSPNGTALYGDRKVGEHYEKVEVWKKVTPAVLKKNEKVTVGIFTEVKEGDYVEWVASIYGVKIEEWSSWTASLNVDLIEYWAFEDNEANTVVLAEVGTNGVFNDGNTEDKNVTGKVNSAFDLDGNNDRVDISSVSIDMASDFTVNLWINPDNVDGGQQNFLNLAGAGTFQFILDDSGGGGKNKGIRILWEGVSFVSSIELVSGQWYLITLAHDQGVSTKLYINGRLNGSATSTSAGTTTSIEIGSYNSGSNPFTGIIDEPSMWNRLLTPTEILDQLYNNDSGNTYTNVSDVSPIVELNSPANNTNYTASPTLVNFTCYGSDDFNLTSMGLYIDGTLDQLNATGINNTNYTFSKSLTQGNYNWTCEGTDNESQTTKPVARLFRIHTTTPSSFIYDPTGIINYHLDGNNLTLNWSVNETGENLTTHITNCTYEYNGVITEVNNTVCTVINQTTFTPVAGVNNLTFTITDEFGFMNTSKTTWTIKVFEINQTYNNETTEGNLEDFLAELRLGSGYSISSVNLNYNGSSNSGQSFASGSNTVLRKTNLLIPNVGINTNFTFYWNVTLSDSTNLNLSFKNQTVHNLSLDNCSSYTNELFNFTVLDEEDQTILPNATVETAFNIYDITRTQLILNYSQIFEKVNPVRICMNINLTGDSEFVLDTIVRYEEVFHANEYYNIVNQTLTNETAIQRIKLYDLNLSDSTDFQLTFTGSDFLPVENALVYVDRQYISENTFKTVELPKTDYNGQSVLHLVRNDVIYNVRITKDGIVLGNFENLVAFCDDFTIGDCNIELNAFDSVESVFNYADDLGLIYTAPTYNETQNLISFNFLTSDGLAKEVTLEVTRNDIFGNRSVCNSTLISSGGTLQCSIDPNLEDSSLRVSIYVDGIITVTGGVELEPDNYGVAGYLVMFVMGLSFILMFSGSKTGVLISLGITLAGSIGLSIVRGDLIGVGASGLWLLIIIFIGIYKLNKDKTP